MYRKVFSGMILFPLAIMSAAMLCLYSLAPFFCHRILHTTISAVRHNNNREYVKTTNADRMTRKLAKVYVMYHDTRHENIILLRWLRSASLTSEGIIMSKCRPIEEDLAA